jgi:thiamine pyrophosphate-dependent acetolactate synthase large subunit-like protein
MTERITGHAGDLMAETLLRHGVDRIFTLSGGHIFPVFDGAHKRGIRLIDTRHEQSAGFAAEAHAKLSRRAGVAAVTAGPGVTNAMSPITSAFFNGSPAVFIGGRSPQMRWGQGSLQEMDHLPLVRTITKRAETVFDATLVPSETAAALATATTAHRGPTYLDVPMEVLFTHAEAEIPAPRATEPPVSGDLDGAVRALAAAERPVLLAGSDVWADGAEKALRDLAAAQWLPIFANGMGRGALPADHELAFSAARGHAFSHADLVIVAGTPLDFRLGFGSFGEARVVHLADHVSAVAGHVTLAAAAGGPLARIFEGLATATPIDRDAWLKELRGVEESKRDGFIADLRNDATPIHPARVYGELLPRLARDGVVIADGGDFASYAGKFIDVFEPGGWLDPGPYGCLGISPGYALAAGLLEPDRQIVVLLGDGAAGFGMGDWDTLVRFGVNVTMVCGNNGIWGLEKHPMKFLYGYDVAADLRPETRYDEVMRCLGGHGELVHTPDELGPALDRALATPGPSLVNVITDPTIAYPRSSNLA